MRLVTSFGTIDGYGRADLLRKTLDMTIRAEPPTTSPLALNVPIRIRGSFESPTVGAALGAFDKARMIDEPTVRALRPELQTFARTSGCLQ